MCRGRKRSRSALSKGSSASSSPEPTATRWNAVSAGRKAEESGLNGISKGGPEGSTFGHSRFGGQGSRFSTSSAALDLHSGGVSDQQATGYSTGYSAFDLIRNTGVALDVTGFANHPSAPPSPPATLPLTPVLSSASVTPNSNIAKVRSTTSRPSRTVKRQRLVKRPSSQDVHYVQEQPFVHLENRQERRSWEAGESPVDLWNLARSVEMTGRVAEAEAGCGSSQSQFDDNKGLDGPLAFNDYFESKSSQNGKNVERAESQDVGDADSLLNNQYLSSNAFLHNLVSQFTIHVVCRIC